ncbi:MAG: two pore domain potassium channel family protein [Bacilli bacterium]|nr:two pore domain potassium channel family protein [Bacilli bacterium]
MANKKEPMISSGFKRVIMLVLGGICSTLVLIFSVLTIVTISKGDYEHAPAYLLGVFVSMAFSGIVVFLRHRSKFNLIRAIIIILFNIALGVISLFAKQDLYLFSLTAGLYCLLVVISRILIIIEKKTIRSLIFNIIIIVLFTLLSIGMFIPVDAEGVGKVILIECLFISFTALAEVAAVAFGQLKFKVLFKIIINTFALEVLFGLLATMVAGALVLLSVEEAFTNFGDALWYCFAVVTTIGFGDLVATTLIGRLITVLLGVYGIIAVAVITSIVVNFYNETSGKKDVKELKNIQKEEDKENR